MIASNGTSSAVATHDASSPRQPRSSVNARSPGSPISASSWADSGRTLAADGTSGDHDARATTWASPRRARTQGRSAPRCARSVMATVVVRPEGASGQPADEPTTETTIPAPRSRRPASRTRPSLPRSLTPPDPPAHPRSCGSPSSPRPRGRPRRSSARRRAARSARTGPVAPDPGVARPPRGHRRRACTRRTGGLAAAARDGEARAQATVDEAAQARTDAADALRAARAQLRSTAVYAYMHQPGDDFVPELRGDSSGGTRIGTCSPSPSTTTDRTSSTATATSNGPSPASMPPDRPSTVPDRS